MNQPSSIKKLDDISDQMGRFVSYMESEQRSREEMNRKVSAIHEFLFGSSQQSRPINLRLDRLEQIQENRKWLMRAMGTSVIGLAIERIVSYLKGH